MDYLLHFLHLACLSSLRFFLARRLTEEANEKRILLRAEQEIEINMETLIVRFSPIETHIVKERGSSCQADCSNAHLIMNSKGKRA